MNLPSIPDPHETMTELSEHLAAIHRAFEHGVFKARNHFETESLSHDPSAFPTIVRLHAKDYLKKKGMDAVNIEDVSLCGLSLKLPKFLIKMWKSDDSELPVPGHSAPKQQFYTQQLAFPQGEGEPTFFPLHLVVLWNLDTYHNLSRLWLVCPKGGDDKTAQAWWAKRIPDPTSVLPATVEHEAPPDLPIRLKTEPASKVKIG